MNEYALFTTRHKTLTLQRAGPGGTYIRRALSLSPPPVRERGEVRGSCTSTIASNHRLPFLANVPLTAYRPPCAMPFSGVFIWNITLVYYILTSFTNTSFQTVGLKPSLRPNGRHPFVYIINKNLLVFIIKPIILPTSAAPSLKPNFRHAVTHPNTLSGQPSPVASRIYQYHTRNRGPLGSSTTTTLALGGMGEWSP